MQIKDVVIKDLTHYEDKRGGFAEVFRNSWFPNHDHSKIQLNNSYSEPYTVRGLHYHEYQYDYWYVVSGRLQVGLFDLRLESPTYLKSMEIMLDYNQGIFIPPLVAHGFASMAYTELIYVVNQEYNPSDDNELRWNDPELGIDWLVKNPIVSKRDKNSPMLQEVLDKLYEE